MGEALERLGAFNAAVIGAYLVGILAIGYWTSRRVRSSRSYFTADGRMNFVVVGLSILGTYLSALTMMGLPGMSFGAHDWTWTVQLPFLIITAFVITRLVLPRYREAGVISVYQYLERRVHVSSRCLASLSFVVFAVARMGLVLYLPALALHTVTGIDLPTTIVLMGVVITVYTVLGGIEAVVWTDAIQVVIFTVGALLTVAFIFAKLGDASFTAIAAEHGKFRTLIPGLDSTKIVTAWLILQTVFETIRIYGTQQDITQRYVTTPSTRKANLSVWIAILAYIPLGFLFYFIGTALFVFYKTHADPALAGLKNDAVYPHFIVSQLPPGVAGLLLAGLIAAAMSSVDSLMNSASTVCIEDFYRRFSRTSRPDRHYLLVARLLTVVWGVLAIGMALLFIGVQYAQWAWTKVMAISTNGVLGLMALAFLPFRVNRWAAVAGFAACYACLAVLGLATNVNALLWPVIGNLVCFFVALGLHALFVGPFRMERPARGASGEDQP